jgi:hypothetical protein
MPVDWLIYGLLVLALAKLMNTLLFNRKPASAPTALALSGALFFVNMTALNALEKLRPALFPDSYGAQITPYNLFDIGGAFVFAMIFFAFLKRRKRKTDAG